MNIRLIYFLMSVMLLLTACSKEIPSIIDEKSAIATPKPPPILYADDIECDPYANSHPFQIYIKGKSDKTTAPIQYHKSNHDFTNVQMTFDLNENYFGINNIPQGSGIAYEYNWTCTPIAPIDGQIDNALSVIETTRTRPITTIRIPQGYEYEVLFELNTYFEEEEEEDESSIISIHSTLFSFYVTEPEPGEFVINITESEGAAYCYSNDSSGGGAVDGVIMP